MAVNDGNLSNKRLYLCEQNPACFPEVHRHGLMEKCGSNKEAPSANNADNPSAMSFWKKNSKTVPGWPSPSKESVASWATKSTKSSSGGGGSSSFQVFEDSVRDAWDIEDDEFSVISSSDVKISKKVAQSTALSVINSHRSGAISPTTSSKLDGPHHHHHQHHNQHHHQFVQQPDIHTQSSHHKLNTSITPAAPANSTSALYPGPNANIEVYKCTSASNTATAASHASSSLPNGNAREEGEEQQNNSSCSGGGDGRPHRNSLSSGSTLSSSSSSSSSSGKPRVINRLETESEKGKAEKIGSLLEGAVSTDLKELQSLSYSGLPVSVRGTTWRLLAGYLPANTERREEALRRKREEYWKCVQQYYDSRKEESHQDTFRQIHIDIPRMCPLIALFQQRVVQELFERILFIWAIRHPASGYVQGMNDLVTPFFVVFLEEVLPVEVEVESFDVSRLNDEVRNNIEADSYWCMSKFLDSIQVNYIFAQTGIQEKVKKLKELIERIDAPLHHHLQRHEIDYLQFSFRWMNNLLMRELPLRCTIRLWDTYLSEPDGCGSVLLYVCAAFLRHWRDQLIRQKDFQGLMLLLQNLPTQNWETPEVNVIVAEAYRLKYTYDNTHWH